MQQILVIVFLAVMGIALGIQIYHCIHWGVRCLPLRRRPEYGTCHGTKHYIADQVRILGVLSRFFSRFGHSPGADAPYVLNRFWWHVDDERTTTSSIVAVLDYVEDLCRYVGQSSYDHCDQVTVGRYNTIEVRVHRTFMQEFRLTLEMNLTFESEKFSASDQVVTVDYNWQVDNKLNHRSLMAPKIIAYTFNQLDALLLPRLSQISAPPTGAQGSLIDMVRRRTRGEKEALFTPTPEHVVRRQNYWPSPQEFNEAIQIPNSAFHLAELCGAVAEANEIGLPRPVTGAFASVYKMRSAHAEVWAVKCFLRDVQDQAARYAQISEYLIKSNLNCMIGFEFIERGICVNKSWYPIVKMQWIEGLTLQDYIDYYRNEPERMELLCDAFVTMCATLRAAGVAHGDLQHGNIIITSDGLKLVDYDGLYVPAMSGLRSNELGHRNYQHPGRSAEHFGPCLDNFSAWVIFLSLKALVFAPELWNIPGAGDEHLIFSQVDFCDPGSQVMQIVTTHTHESVRRVGECIRRMCLLAPEEIPYLDDHTAVWPPNCFLSGASVSQ